MINVFLFIPRLVWTVGAAAFVMATFPLLWWLDQERR